MIAEADLVALLTEAFPASEVAVLDKTGMSDHYRVYIGWQGFAGKTLIEQHQSVYQALQAAMNDGRLHAVELKTEALQPTV